MTSGDPRTLESPGAITPAPSARWDYAVVARDLVKTYPRPGWRIAERRCRALV
jgi:hypothetical protein